MDFWKYIVLFLSVIFGGGLAFYFQKNNKTVLQTVLSFSGAYILGISVLHLMPHVFIDESERIGLWVLLGFFIQLILEQFSGGVEHGHIHAPYQPRRSFAFQVLIGLCVHAFLEGMPLSLYEHIHEGHDHAHHNHLLWGIILHKAPAAFALVLLFIVSGYKNSFIFVSLFVFAMMSPLGAFLGKQLIIEPYGQRVIMAVVVGSFLHIATTILFETDDSQHHRISRSKIAAILFGLLGAVGTLYV